MHWSRWMDMRSVVEVTIHVQGIYYVYILLLAWLVLVFGVCVGVGVGV